MKNIIDITYGETLTDCTCPYYITINKKFTVKDFVKYALSEITEWGYIGINDGESLLGNPRIEYRHGKLITENFDEDILNKTVVSLTGSGGWSKSDYLLTI